MKLRTNIPVYNEENSFEKIVERVLAVNLGKVDKEIIIPDNGSEDQTREII